MAVQDNLKEKAARGIMWGGLGNAAMQLAGLAFGVVLGRLLTPADYGMVAMVAIFPAVAAALQNSGFSSAIANMPAPSDRDYNSVFWFNITAAAALYIILWVAAPHIASYYGEGRICALCRYACLSVPLSALGTAQSAYLFKNLRAKQQAKASVAAVLVSSAAGVSLAYMGMAYWSLATQGLVYVGVNSALQWRYSPWRPSLRIDFRPVAGMFRFSSMMLATTIATQVNNNVLNILLGRYFTPAAAGNYNQAYQWNFKAYSLVQNMLAQVAQPVLASLNADPGRQLAALRKLVRFTAFVSFPLLLFFGAAAHEFIVIALTEKWEASAGLLSVMCLCGAVAPVSAVLANAVVSRGKSATYFLCTAALGLCTIGAMAAIWPMGMEAMVWAYAGLNVAWLPVWHFFVRRLTGYRLDHLAADVLPFAAAAALSAAAGVLAAHWADSLWLRLAAKCAVPAVCYYAFLRLSHARILEESMRFVGGKLPFAKRPRPF